MGGRTPDAQSREPEGPRGLSGPLLSFASRLVEWVRRQRAGRSPQTERLLLVAALALFAVLTWVAFQNLPELEQPVRWVPLILIGAIAAPAMAFLNALEYRVAGKILGHRIGLASAIRVSVIATAANRLPIPGAVLVRVGALKRLGSGYGKATSSTATVGLAWMGTSFLAAGVLQYPSGRWEIGTALLGAGIGAVALSYALMRWHAPPGSAPGLMAELLLIELGAVLMPTVKFYVALHALGFPVSIAQSAALAVSIVVAASTGFFPGGLGLREAIAAGLSPLVGLPAAVGLLASAVTRVIGLVAFLLLAAVVLLVFGRETPAEARAEAAVGPPVPHDD